MSRGYERYSVGNIVNNYMISLYGDHFEMHRDIKSLRCAPRNNTVGQLYSDYKQTNILIDKEVRFLLTTDRG